jgi:FkbM family methyltransferase
LKRKLIKHILNYIFNYLNMRLVDVNESGTHIALDLFQELDIGGQVIFDVGANTGYVAREYWTEFKDAQIHLFEPNPDVFRLLESNTADSDRFILNNCGVGSKNETLTLYVDPRNSLVSSFAHDHELEVFECDVVTIDSYIKKYQLSSIGLLKVDVEGFEINVLRGAKKSLVEGVIDAVIVEATFTPNKIKSSDFFEPNKFMNDCGFKVQGFYDLDYSHIYSKGVFKLANVLFLKDSNAYLTD